MFWMNMMEKKSYCDYRKRVGPWMESQACSKNRHLYSSPGNFALHASMGVSSSALANLKVFCMHADSRCLPVWVVSFRNTPVSGTLYRQAGFLSLERRQLVQIKVARPPADAPVSTTFVELNNPYNAFSSQNNERVILAPRKQRLASLQRMGSFAQPWCSDPSQQGTIILVQSANLLVSGFGDRQPPPFCVSGHSRELPSRVFDLWQADSSVEGKSSAPKKPPPQNQIMKLFLAMPWWMQQIGGLPSIHLASGSLLLTTFRKC